MSKADVAPCSPTVSAASESTIRRLPQPKNKALNPKPTDQDTTTVNGAAPTDSDDLNDMEVENYNRIQLATGDEMFTVAMYNHSGGNNWANEYGDIEEAVLVRLALGRVHPSIYVSTCQTILPSAHLHHFHLLENGPHILRGCTISG